MKYLMAFLLFPMLLASQIAADVQTDAALNADRFLGYDNLGALYYVRENTFYKSADGKTWQYKNIGLGKIARADLQNPLGITLFYQDFNAVVLLDNQLNETRRILFSELSQPLMITACGTASRNQLWVYDSVTQQIGLFDYVKNQLRLITQQLNGKIVFYQNDFNHFIWMDQSMAMYRTDIFGKIESLGKAPAFDSGILTADGLLIHLSDKNLHLTNLKTGQSQVVETGKKSIESFWYSPGILTTFTDRHLTNYKIKIP